MNPEVVRLRRTVHELADGLRYASVGARIQCFDLEADLLERFAAGVEIVAERVEARGWETDTARERVRVADLDIFREARERVARAKAQES